MLATQSIRSSALHSSVSQMTNGSPSAFAVAEALGGAAARPPHARRRTAGAVLLQSAAATGAAQLLHCQVGAEQQLCRDRCDLSGSFGVFYQEGIGEICQEGVGVIHQDGIGLICQGSNLWDLADQECRPKFRFPSTSVGRFILSCNNRDKTLEKLSI
jgi:hypothetical protein